MKNIILSFLLVTNICHNLSAQTKILTHKEAHEKLDDVMEIIDTTFLKSHLIEVEKAYQ